MSKVFSEKPKVVFRRPRNLKDSMERSKVKQKENSENRMKKCGK